MKKKLTKKESEMFSIIGSIGGKASFKKRGKKGMSDLGKKGAIARWKNHKKNK